MSHKGVRNFFCPTNHPMATTELSISIHISYTGDIPATSASTPVPLSSTVASQTPVVSSVNANLESQRPLTPVTDVYRTASGKCIHQGWCKHVKNYSKALRRCSCFPTAFSLDRLCVVHDMVHTVNCASASSNHRIVTLCRDCWRS